MLERGESPSPEGYRVPNVREGVLMFLYCGQDNNWWGGDSFTVSSYYSFGYFGNNYDYQGGEYFYSWYIFNNRVTIGAPISKQIRFVRDIQ